MSQIIKTTSSVLRPDHGARTINRVESESEKKSSSCSQLRSPSYSTFRHSFCPTSAWEGLRTAKKPAKMPMSITRPVLYSSLAATCVIRLLQLHSATGVDCLLSKQRTHSQCRTSGSNVGSRGGVSGITLSLSSPLSWKKVTTNSVIMMTMTIIKSLVSGHALRYAYAYTCSLDFTHDSTLVIPEIASLETSLEHGCPSMERNHLSFG